MVGLPHGHHDVIDGERLAGERRDERVRAGREVRELVRPGRRRRHLAIVDADDRLLDRIAAVVIACDAGDRAGGRARRHGVLRRATGNEQDDEGAHGGRAYPKYLLALAARWRTDRNRRPCAYNGLGMWRAALVGLIVTGATSCGKQDR